MKTPTLEVLAERTDHKDRPSAEDYWTKALRISELRYRRLFETAQDGILILDGNTGDILDVNPFLIDLLDYSFEELRGRKLWEIGQFEDIAANRAAFETLQKNEYVRYENLPLRRKDGTQIQVEFVSNVYWVETEKVIQCNIRDITARTESRTNSEAHLAGVELANTTKDAWLIAHSQHLRAPLMAITSMLGLLEVGHKLAPVRPLREKPSEFDEAAFEHIRRNFQRLVHHFNELSDLAGECRFQLDEDLSVRPTNVVVAASISSAESGS
jgi:PAS domain S-box-containing protein